MIEQYSKLIFGTISLFLGIIFLFFNKKIIRIQGESKKDDYSEKIRIQTFKVAGVIAILGGTFLLYRYFY